MATHPRTVKPIEHAKTAPTATRSTSPRQRSARAGALVLVLVLASGPLRIARR